MTTNRALAAKADRIAREAPAGGLQRRASGSLAVALRTTSSLNGARRALETLRDPAVRLAAGQMLTEMTTSAQAEESTSHDD
jgi:hypothetical protein